MMDLPEEVYRRRHFGTPESMLLIIVNYVVMAIAIDIWALCDKINWFFWVVTAILAYYNYYTIRKNREEFDRKTTIAYIISLAGIVFMFFIFRLKAHNCQI